MIVILAVMSRWKNGWLWHRIKLLSLVAFLAAPSALAAGQAKRHPLTVDDVLDTVAIDRVATSPDGDWIAAVVQRPARAGEAYGRNAYEIDPSRSDVWLVSRRTGERRNLTKGAATAAGFWCALVARWRQARHTLNTSRGFGAAWRR